MTDAFDTTEFLDVGVDHLAWVLALVAGGGWPWVECTQPAEAAPAQRDADGGHRPAELAGDSWSRHALASQHLDLLFRLRPAAPG